MQPCEQAQTISEIKSDVEILKASDSRHENVLTRMEDKIDKILWFTMGFFGTAIVALIGFIGTLLA